MVQVSFLQQFSVFTALGEVVDNLLRDRVYLDQVGRDYRRRDALQVLLLHILCPRWSVEVRVVFALGLVALVCPWVPVFLVRVFRLARLASAVVEID